MSDTDEGYLLGRGDTEELPSSPLTPETYTIRSGDFARLVPLNDAAKWAFHELACKVKSTPDWFPYIQRCLYIETFQRHQTPQVHSSEPDSEAEGDITTKPAALWTGHYRLSLVSGLLPKQLGLGWIVGGGRRDYPDLGVEILLTLDKKRDKVYGRHARIVHNSEGRLMINTSPGKKVMKNNEMLEDETSMLTGTTTNLLFGTLLYTFEFSGLSDNRYRQQLEDLREQGLFPRQIHQALDVTPSDSQYELYGYVFYPATAYGASGILLPCTRKSDGRSFAAKRLTRTLNNTSKIHNEIEIYNKVKGHPNASTLIEVVESNPNNAITRRSPIDEVYLIQEPLATQSLREFMARPATEEVRTLIMKQLIQVVSHFHAKGVMHRDVKPENVVIVRGTPPRAILIDYDNATDEEYSTDHSKGTIPYLAPEVMALKRGEASQSYSQKCDVWGLGLVCYELFMGQKINWPDGVSKSSHQVVIKNISKRSGFQWETIRQMLEWDTNKRPSAQDLVSLSDWANI